MPAFELFTQRRRPVGDRPFVTIQAGAREFTINRAAFDLLGQPEAVEMLYDRKERIIGFRKANADLLHAYPVRRGHNSETYHITAGAFISYYRLQAKEPRRFVAQVVDDDVLAIALNSYPGSSNSAAVEE